MESKLEQIGKLYIAYNKVKLHIVDLKNNRNVNFKPCIHSDEKHNTCYDDLKYYGRTDELCSNCEQSWKLHLEIVKNGCIAGGLKNKLNKLTNLS